MTPVRIKLSPPIRPAFPFPRATRVLLPPSIYAFSLFQPPIKFSAFSTDAPRVFEIGSSVNNRRIIECSRGGVFRRGFTRSGRDPVNFYALLEPSCRSCPGIFKSESSRMLDKRADSIEGGLKPRKLVRYIGVVNFTSSDILALYFPEVR